MKKLFPYLAFLAVALVSLMMAGFAYYASQEAARIKFSATADDTLNRIESRIDMQLSLLRSTKALFDARNGDISRSEFKAFFDALDVKQHFAGLRGIGYLRLVKTGDEAVAERAIRDNFGVQRAIYPASSQPWRTPIVLFEPLDTSKLAPIGYDMMSEPVRRAAIDTAWGDEQLHASGRVMLGQSTGDGQAQPGFLVFSKLTLETVPDGISARTPYVGGFLFAAFRAGDLFEVALAKAPLLPVNVAVYDGAIGPGNLLYRSHTPPASSYGSKLLEIREVTVAGRTWTIEFRPTSAFAAPSSRAAPVMLGLFGLLLASAIALVARYQERAYDAVSRLHETTEKSLVEKDLMLQEMKHRIKNSITRVLAIARQTASGSSDMAEFSASFAARLQAMAASQDMLTRSRWQKADLHELLRIELGQVFGKDLPDELLDGPPVLLDEKMTQALGLTFHELATNALKYGEPSKAVSNLKVSWKMTGPGRERRLTIEWRESGQSDVGPPEKTGFGTKLIDMNITRELGGTIERDFRSTGLAVKLKIPFSDNAA